MKKENRLILIRPRSNANLSTARSIRWLIHLCRAMILTSSV